MLCCLAYHSQAQQISVQVDKDSIQIGEPIQILLESKDWKAAQWPTFPETKDGIELIQQSAIDTIDDGGTLVYKQMISVSAYDSGTYMLPSQFDPATNAFIFDKPLKVSTIAVDTTAPYMPEKSVQDAELSWYESPVFLVICAILILALIAYFIYKKFKKQPKTTAAPTVTQPSVPLDVQTYQALDALVAKRWHESGDAKLFYSELSEIVRQYIEDRFKIPALENTTQEVLQTAKRTPLLKKHRDPIKLILRKADLVKFAKADAHIVEMEEAIQAARSFVNHTYRKEEEHVNE